MLNQHAPSVVPEIQSGFVDNYSTEPFQAGRQLEGNSRHPAALLYEKTRGYRNELLINKFRGDLSLSVKDAERLANDVKRFIALCSLTSQPLAPPRAIDEGWHQFILITRDYSKFCDEYFDRYIHHRPADPLEQARDYSSDRRHTRELAEVVFGALSSNWDESITGARCTHNCGNDDCDEA